MKVQLYLLFLVGPFGPLILLSSGCTHRVPLHPPAIRPPTIACTGNPASLHAETDEFITVHADTTNPDNATLTFSWTATGGSVDGTGPDVRWKPGTAAPGSYTVTGHVDDGRGNVANCTVEVHLERRPNRTPVMSCQSASQTVPVGQSVQITAAASDPDNDPLTYSWQSSGGHVTGSGAQVQFDSTGAALGHYTVTGTVSDGRGGLADCRLELDVQKPLEQVQLEQRLSLHSIFFPTATVKNPNGGLLASQQHALVQLANDFKRYLTFRPDAHLVLKGHWDTDGCSEEIEARSERAANLAKEFLVSQGGVPTEDIETEGMGEEQQLSAEEVIKLIDQDPNLTNGQRARIKKNISTVVQAENRRVDVLLESAQGTTISIREYPFASADVSALLRAPELTACPADTANGTEPRVPQCNGILVFVSPTSVLLAKPDPFDIAAYVGCKLGTDDNRLFGCGHLGDCRDPQAADCVNSTKSIETTGQQLKTYPLNDLCKFEKTQVAINDATGARIGQVTIGDWKITAEHEEWHWTLHPSDNIRKLQLSASGKKPGDTGSADIMFEPITLNTVEPTFVERIWIWTRARSLEILAAMGLALIGWVTKVVPWGLDKAQRWVLQWASNKKVPDVDVKKLPGGDVNKKVADEDV